MKVTDPLKYAIFKQSFEYAGDVVNNQMDAKHDVRKLKREKGKQAADSVNQELSVTLKRAMDPAQERGASTWLTTQPIQEFGFTLHQGARMPWLFAKTGNSHGSPPLVLVVPSFQLNMPCPVPKVASRRFDIMKYET